MVDLPFKKQLSFSTQVNKRSQIRIVNAHYFEILVFFYTHDNDNSKIADLED